MLSGHVIGLLAHVTDVIISSQQLPPPVGRYTWASWYLEFFEVEFLSGRIFESRIVFHLVEILFRQPQLRHLIKVRHIQISEVLQKNCSKPRSWSENATEETMLATICRSRGVLKQRSTAKMTRYRRQSQATIRDQRKRYRSYCQATSQYIHRTPQQKKIRSQVLQCCNFRAEDPNRSGYFHYSLLKLWVETINIRGFQWLPLNLHSYSPETSLVLPWRRRGADSRTFVHWRIWILTQRAVFYNRQGHHLDPIIVFNPQKIITERSLKAQDRNSFWSHLDSGVIIDYCSPPYWII